ncbi:DUF3298 and DUF4163 domain-containing protein [Winogradskyella bathintestinalis]|uniref:DUF4163 domain-containing protein n=1 Tax=Winogradskyella bathintestinalis TaxID=3035208 RepID=A0ABT7ZRX7_9FLAO|nr:DUF3298 and DUF4163 domain-containing protein [Winogradskyella bathintestinalis]MDN3491760.1 DUF4163 domain-containing protein [Winogradskyella bathintestinalis]
MKHITPIIALLFVLNSCTSETKPAKFETISIEEPFEAEISATYSKAKGNTELSKAINANVESAIIKTLSKPKNTDNLKDVLKAFNTEYLSFKNEFSEVSEPVWELHIETELTYQSDNVITIAISNYEFKGGAHGNDQIQFLNLDAITGKVLSNDEIITDKENFKILAKEYFVKSLDNNKDNLTIEDFFFGKPFHLPENIGFSSDGLILLYNVYEVASYDRGYTEFLLPYDTVQPYLKIN